MLPSSASSISIQNLELEDPKRYFRQVQNIARKRIVQGKCQANVNSLWLENNHRGCLDLWLVQKYQRNLEARTASLPPARVTPRSVCPLIKYDPRRYVFQCNILKITRRWRNVCSSATRSSISSSPRKLERRCEKWMDMLPEKRKILRIILVHRHHMCTISSGYRPLTHANMVAPTVYFLGTITQTKKVHGHCSATADEARPHYSSVFTCTSLRFIAFRLRLLSTIYQTSA